jgi:hypothetical protein
MCKNTLYKLTGMALVVLAFASCETLETAKQDVSPIASPDNYPLVTVTPNTTSTTVSEGNTITYTIKLDKMLDRSVTFTPHQTGGTADESDFVVKEVTISPYTLEAEMVVELVADDYPEAEETLQITVAIESLAEKNLVNLESPLPYVIDLKIANVNDAEALTIGLIWEDDHADFDFVIWANTASNPMEEWGDMGASSHYPEIDKSIVLDDEDGTYYVNIMDWEAGPFDYKFSIGHPNGTVQFIEGTFDTSKYNYTNDIWTAWPNPKEADSYRVLQVVKTGSAFVVTKLDVPMLESK